MGSWGESQLRSEKAAGLTTFLKWFLPSPQSWDPQRDPGPPVPSPCIFIGSWDDGCQKVGQGPLHFQKVSAVVAGWGPPRPLLDLPVGVGRDKELQLWPTSSLVPHPIACLGSPCQTQRR